MSESNRQIFNSDINVHTNIEEPDNTLNLYVDFKELMKKDYPQIYFNPGRYLQRYINKKHLENGTTNKKLSSKSKKLSLHDLNIRPKFNQIDKFSDKPKTNMPSLGRLNNNSLSPNVKTKTNIKHYRAKSFKPEGTKMLNNIKNHSNSKLNNNYKGKNKNQIIKKNDSKIKEVNKEKKRGVVMSERIKTIKQLQNKPSCQGSQKVKFKFDLNRSGNIDRSNKKLQDKSNFNSLPIKTVSNEDSKDFNKLFQIRRNLHIYMNENYRVNKPSSNTKVIQNDNNSQSFSNFHTVSHPGSDKREKVIINTDHDYEKEDEIFDHLKTPRNNILMTSDDFENFAVNN